MSLVLASAYAGWAGSLPLEIAEQRLKQSLRASHLPPEEFVATMVPTMFSSAVATDRVDEFAASVSEFHPAGFRAMALACAADLREVLPEVQVPTLLLYGDEDVRAPPSELKRRRRFGERSVAPRPLFPSQPPACALLASGLRCRQTSSPGTRLVRQPAGSRCAGGRSSTRRPHADRRGSNAS